MTGRPTPPDPSAATLSLAVMQPYFYPYAGYFRLFSAADRFVLFDCVQFPRRGRVHRTEVTGPDGKVEWLTLPLARQPRDTLIRDLAFAADARLRFDAQLRRLPWLLTASGQAAERVLAHLNSPLESVVDFLEQGLELTCALLGLRGPALRSSSLAIDPRLHGQARILEIVTRLGATQYINAPGGRELYDPKIFSSARIELSFLPAFDGQAYQLLPALLSDDLDRVRAEATDFPPLQRPGG